MRAWLVAAILGCLAFAAEPNWAYEHSWQLAKDERAHFYVREKDSRDWRRYELAWTHYDGNDLILFAWYKDFVKQYVFKLSRRLDFIRAQALPDQAIPRSDRAEIFLKFAAFKQGRAKIDLFIQDANSRLEVDFLKD